MDPVRLACIKRAASVRPEPGSNSLSILYISRIPAGYIPKRYLAFRLPFLTAFLRFRGTPLPRRPSPFASSNTKEFKRVFKLCLLSDFQGPAPACRLLRNRAPVKRGIIFYHPLPSFVNTSPSPPLPLPRVCCV